MDIIIGTSNKGKVREIASILMPMGYHLVPTSKDIDETGETIEDNALIKALAYAEDYPDTVVIAEDSGLVVPALNNLPGPYSSRFHSITIDDNLNITNIGREVYTTDKTELDIKNNERLVSLIEKVPENQRAAYFEVCFIIVKNKEVLFKVTEKSYGFITTEPKGTNGFGYDPVFIGNDTFGKTYAELDNARKNLRSHRKKALQKLGLWMAQNIKKS